MKGEADGPQCAHEIGDHEYEDAGESPAHEHDLADIQRAGHGFDDGIIDGKAQHGQGHEECTLEIVIHRLETPESKDMS